MEDANRPLLPAKRRNDYEISGRNGTVDFGGETYETRQIIVDICLISDNMNNLQTLARDIAFWLSGKGILVFDDEPDWAYDAVVYNQVSAEDIIRTKRASVEFECQSFAKSINFLQSASRGITSGFQTGIASGGTQATSARIILNNTGATIITSITISRRALRR
jgi:predicted phage tail component-like protein